METPFIPHTKRSDVGLNIKHCLQKVVDGHLAAAEKVLLSSGVATSNLETQLEAKHPLSPPPPKPNVTMGGSPLSVD